MWPFTSRRIFANRWWALAFVAFICWQAVDLVGDKRAADRPSDASDQAASFLNT
jgi:hypothetical protein